MMLYAPAALIVCFTYFNIFRILTAHKGKSAKASPLQQPEWGDWGGAGLF